MEALNQLVIEAFDFAVGLGVTRRRSIVMDVVSLDECLEMLGSELFSIVRDDLNGLPVSPNDVFQDLDRSSRGTFFEGPGESSGGGIINGGDYVSVAVICLEQFPDEVNLPEFESLFDTIRVNCRRV